MSWTLRCVSLAELETVLCLLFSTTSVSTLSFAARYNGSFVHSGASGTTWRQGGEQEAEREGGREGGGKREQERGGRGRARGGGGSGRGTMEGKEIRREETDRQTDKQT